MFIDVCFPENNELGFVETAKKLSTDGLCFLYPKKGKDFLSKDLKIYSGSLWPAWNDKQPVFCSNLEEKKKGLIYFFEPNRYKKSFHFPVKGITQVMFKDMKDKEAILGFSFYYMLKSKLYPENLELVSFIIKMAQKYKIDVFAASFARRPEEMRGLQELKSALAVMGMEKSSLKQSGEVLGKLLEGKFS